MVVPVTKMAASWSRLSRERIGRLLRAEDVLLPGTTNSRGSQEQPSITGGVATHGENTHRDSSGNTENASSVMQRRRGVVFTDTRRNNDELKDLFRSLERAMRVMERSAAANITDATQEALRRMVEHIRNEPNHYILGIPIEDMSLIKAVMLPFAIYAVFLLVSIIKYSDIMH